MVLPAQLRQKVLGRRHRAPRCHPWRGRHDLLIRWIAPIDLRSDTATKPSAAMRQAMASAEVGDDWLGEDPTVNRLQDRVAELTGKDAALYLPTGTMCNQIAMHAFVRSGHFAVCETTAHTGRAEAASAAALSGIAFRYLDGGSHGQLTAGQVDAALAGNPSDTAAIDLVTIENTHNFGGGAVMGVAEVQAIAAVCGRRPCRCTWTVPGSSTRARSPARSCPTMRPAPRP